MKRVVLLAGLLCAVFVHAQSPDRVRIKVAGLFHSDQFVVQASPRQPLVMKAGDRELETGESSRSRVLVKRVGREITVGEGGQSIRTQSVTLTGKSGDADFTLIIPSRFRRQYHGTLTVLASKTELTAIVEMDTETAVASIVAAEATSSMPLESLKALAVAARSYLSSERRHADADFCDTTHCQYLRNPPPVTSPAVRAAAETRGMVLRYQGKTFPPMYSASCGGRTHTLAELGLAQRGYPYYAVECAYCRQNPDRWMSRITESQAASASKGERGRLELARKLGWNVVPSNSFQSKQTENGVVLSGVGHGHGLGLCERGAAAMAREGKDFRAILVHYYPNAVLDSLR